MQLALFDSLEELWEPRARLLGDASARPRPSTRSYRPAGGALGVGAGAPPVRLRTGCCSSTTSVSGTSHYTTGWRCSTTRRGRVQVAAARADHAPRTPVGAPSETSTTSSSSKARYPAGRHDLPHLRRSGPLRRRGDRRYRHDRRRSANTCLIATAACAPSTRTIASSSSLNSCASRSGGTFPNAAPRSVIGEPGTSASRDGRAGTRPTGSWLSSDVQRLVVADQYGEDPRARCGGLTVAFVSASIRTVMNWSSLVLSRSTTPNARYRAPVSSTAVPRPPALFRSRSSE